MSKHSAEAAYPGLQGLVPGFGPSFSTKFLYFAGKTVPSATGPQPLVLDRVLARRVRSMAQAVGRETGHDPDGSIANWVWRDRNWSPHRYTGCLSFMQAAASQQRQWVPGRPTPRPTCSNCPVQRLLDVDPSPRHARLPQVAGGAGPCSRTGGTRSPAGCRRCAARRWRRAARQR
ncbi:hypothetical protein [Streptomyces sp. NPDC002779]|uniref:8-oxoguanine DNA glycosylase OGG fold protein n=1 Tax=Streptomyces sp. NPDC002779 TaxID=3364664 RepID=UPI0036B226CF